MRQPGSSLKIDREKPGGHARCGVAVRLRYLSQFAILQGSMIEISISAGYGWHLWKVGGGLQPSLESLRLPQEPVDRLKAWSKRAVRDLHAPTFTGRKEFDLEGRALAKELQDAAIGEDIHILFNHWQEFDPGRWAALWRKENLRTGHSDEYWLEEDLPKEVVTKIVHIFPDCGGCYVWDLDGTAGFDEPTIPDELDARFTAWSDSWDACFDSATMKVDKARLAGEKFDERGLALATELKQTMGWRMRVIYCCNLSEPALEVLGDGQTLVWPRGTDFRQQALGAWHGEKRDKS
jgi:hypothetical protein